MKLRLPTLVVVGMFALGAVWAEEPSTSRSEYPQVPSNNGSPLEAGKGRPADSSDGSGALPEDVADNVVELKRPAVIAHGGCYYPFPIPANDPAEPLAPTMSLERSAMYLDALSRRWTSEVGCVTCHTTLSYMAFRPTIQAGPNDAMRELRDFMEYRVANWNSEPPLWDAEALITAISLAVHDAKASGTLQPLTREALERMWSLQREDGTWDWLKANSPPFEHDDYYGAVLVAVGVGLAPEDYAADARIASQLAKLRRYLTETPPPSLHHACWLMWAEATLGDVLRNEARDQQIQQLKKLQRPDGGWSLPSLGGWQGHDDLPIDEAPSDGYGTGLVVFALRCAGLELEDPMVHRGVEWLKSNQRASGSWFTGSLGTSYHLNFISHSGSAFAAMALIACDENK